MNCSIHLFLFKIQCRTILFLTSLKDRMPSYCLNKKINREIFLAYIANVFLKILICIFPK